MFIHNDVNYNKNDSLNTTNKENKDYSDYTVMTVTITFCFIITSVTR